MALDKQKILSELGSVMNQLQGADCGCMGKLFNNTNTYPNMSNFTPASGDYRHGCCRCPGYNRFGSSCNEDPSQTMGSQNMNYSCMGRCNPAKLYSDTYQHLNSNLMQPVVQEVYNDLKTMTPANTIMNNPPGNALSPSQGQTNMQLMHNQGPNSGVGDQTRGMEGHAGVMGSHMSGSGAYTGGMGGHMSGMGGHMTGSGASMPQMGSNIVNMMGGHKPYANETAMEGKALTQPMVIDAPQSPHGKVGVVPLSNHMNSYHPNDSQMHARNNQQPYSNQGNLVNQMQVSNQYKSSAPNANSPQQMPNAYSQHAPGINKFNQMFPGVMQNFGGDLGFDPMAIAVQMNPANQQRAAFDTMQKIMNGNNRTTNNLNQGQPQNTAPADVTQNLIPTDNLVQSNVPPNQTQQSNVPTDHLNQPPSNQQINQSQEQINYQYRNEIQPQPVYTTLTSEPNQQTVQKQQYQGQDQELVCQQSRYLAENPNNTLQNPAKDNENEINLHGYGGQLERLNSQELPESAPIPQSMQIEKVPIFPVDVSKNQSHSSVKRPVYYEYNTLGQPIQRLSASRYRRTDPGGPQTLSPQDSPVNPKHVPRIYSNVKATVSKTSIMGNRRIGKNPSKSQLQQIYNQYKGSQSLTHQNTVNNNEGASYSDGKLNKPQQQVGRAKPNSQVVIEKVGGDTLPNIANDDVVTKPEKIAGQIADVPNFTKTNNEERVMTTHRKGRNGLQDMVYTSYPTSTAWTFHGNPRLPLAVGAHGRKR